jgi:hypothetical protein
LVGEDTNQGQTFNFNVIKPSKALTIKKHEAQLLVYKGSGGGGHGIIGWRGRQPRAKKDEAHLHVYKGLAGTPTKDKKFLLQ